MRSPTTLFILLGAVIGLSAAVPTCELYKLPNPAHGSTCEITIDWRSRDDKAALATCLEYFPTTFVKGEKVGETQTKCIVTAAYQCVGLATYETKDENGGNKKTHKMDDEAHLMFDKCYVFPVDHNNKYIKGKITDYKDKNLCNGGKLSVFYSSTHAKFVGMKAHSLGIDKLWIGITADGRKIEDPETMVHKNMWKLIEGDYWENNDNLVKFTKDDKGNWIYPAKANHYFMRTRTDYLNNRWQGSFERANGANFEATFACEFESQMTANQKWYCNKLPELGIASQYDQRDPVKPRCLYVSASSYAFNGKYTDMAKGCAEKPSALHSAGMDDGTAFQLATDGQSAHTLYENLSKNRGTLRLAGFFYDQIITDTNGWTSNDDLADKRLRWRHINHHGKIQFPYECRISWNEPYPKNEATDFPSKSTTLGLRNGKLIDMNPEVLAPVVCSMAFFQQCELNNPCNEKFECANTNTFQPDNKNSKKGDGFFTCDCPGQKDGVHEPAEENGQKYCEWKKGVNECAYLSYYHDENGNGAPSHAVDSSNENQNLHGSGQNDKLNKIVVRDRCKMTVYSHENYYEATHPGKQNPIIVNEAGYGTHVVPQAESGTLGGNHRFSAATSYKCKCY